MTYIPKVNHDISTTETPTGEMVEGKMIYRKLVKHSGTLSGSAANSFAHGISSFSKIVGMWGTVVHASFTYPILYHNPVVGEATFHFVTYIDATDITLVTGSAWTAGNALSDPWVVVEYLK